MGTRLEKLAIIGVGLIGGSFGLSCRENRIAKVVWGYGRREPKLQKAVELGLIDRYSLDLREVVEDADVVALALPVESIILTGEKIFPYLGKNAVVTDVGSTKEKIVKRMEEILAPKFRFVGAHPIAGTEKSGPEAAFAGLFKDRYCILTPTEGTDAGALDLVRELWEQTGARVAIMDPEEHDRLLALISHLPHMAAYALVNCLSQREGEFPGLFSYTAGGFKDFSRIASSSPLMWKEICLHNGKAIVQAIESFRANLLEIAEAIERGNGEKIEKIFQNSKGIRDSL